MEKKGKERSFDSSLEIAISFSIGKRQREIKGNNIAELHHAKFATRKIL